MWPTEAAEPLLACICLRCDWAYCSNASWEGSFMVRKLSTPFFFFLGVLEPVVVEPWDEAGLAGAVLDDVVLLVSVEARFSALAVEAVVHGRISSESRMPGLLMGSKVVGEESSAGKRFRYVSLGILGARAPTSGAAINGGRWLAIGRCGCQFETEEALELSKGGGALRGWRGGHDSFTQGGCARMARWGSAAKDGEKEELA